MPSLPSICGSILHFGNIYNIYVHYLGILYQYEHNVTEAHDLYEKCQGYTFWAPPDCIYLISSTSREQRNLTMLPIYRYIFIWFLNSTLT